MRNIFFKKISFCLVVFSTLKLLALPSQDIEYAVNMQDGGLILKEGGDSSGYVFRTYRSRSLDHGFFGMGWCTSLESQLIFQGKGVLRMTSCQSSRPLVYNISKTAAAYVNESDSQDQITIKLGYYERRIKNQVVAKFNFKGKLIELVQNSKKLKLLYNLRGLPEKIMVDEKLILFQWHPLLDLVENVKLTKKGETLNITLYQYQGFNLTRVQWNQLFLKYQYDDLDNLISRKTLRKNDNILISYDSEADRVLKIQGQCQELYTYKKTSPQRTLSTVSKSCQNQGALKKQFIFKYAGDLFKPSKIYVSEFPLTVAERRSLNHGGSL
jgi:hypothetical protein